MTALEWAAQGVLLLLLLAALPFALRLERGLAALRGSRDALAGAAPGIEAATRDANLALSGLRHALEAGARGSAEAAALRDDLRFLVERAESLADRLELLVRQNRPQGSVPPPAALAEEPPSPRSQAERDLLRALRSAR